MRVLLIALVIIFALISGFLGWRLYAVQQSFGAEIEQLRQKLQAKQTSSSGQSSLLASKDAELAQLRQKVSSQEKEVADLRHSIVQADQNYQNATKGRVWTIRTQGSFYVTAIAFSVRPEVDKTVLRVEPTLRFAIAGSPRSVKVFATAPNWGAQEKVVPTSGGDIVLEYEFPPAVTEASISLSLR